MILKDKIIKILRKIYRFIFNVKFEVPECEFDRFNANKIIFDKLSSGNPTMITRYGTTELITAVNYLVIKDKIKYWRKIFNFITGNTMTPWWFKEHFKFLDVFSGVFPATQETSEKFSKVYIKDSEFIDILGSFQAFETHMPLNKNVKKLHLETLYPFFVNNPWTAILKNKKILVVHPFQETIILQYSKREDLFENKNILPEFELITLKAVQSAGGAKSDFNSWFDALDYMKDEIAKIEFDICLLGCGAYGLPLAAHVKKLGKQSIHMGGGLQLLFGIKGKRWDDPNYGIKEFQNLEGLMETPYSSLYNDNWIRPLPEDTLDTSKNIDGGTYW